MKIRISMAAAALALFVPAASALCAPATQTATANPVALKGSVQLEKTVEEAGLARTVLSEPKVVVPGDRLLFSTDYSNQGSQQVTDFVVTNPIPAAVELVADSIQAAQVSIDGGKTWGELAKLVAADAAGGKRPARASDVTHVRWVIPAIAPGGSGKVQYHAIVR